MTIYRGPGGTGTATSDSDLTEFQNFVDQAEAARDLAVAAQAAAELAENHAETAEVNAETAETNAETAATNAATSETNAASSASSASSSASSASTSATSAASSASSASSSASAASTSASNASTSATSAGNSATAAASSATAASASASSAASSASTATTQASNASTSATSAASSASSASSSASSASTSATNAASSATSAASSATAAAASAASIDPSTLVRLTGDQTISGVKTFSSSPILSSASANSLAYFNGSKNLTSDTDLTFDGTNLGIGTSSPSQALHVSGSLSATFLLDSMSTGYGSFYATAASSEAIVGSANNQPLGIYTNSVRRATFDTSGNLGIGTASPSYKLDVVGTAGISGAVTLSGGTANGVTYLNGSKVLTSGSALTYNGTTLALSGGAISNANAGNENYLLSDGTSRSSIQQSGTPMYFNANDNTASGGQFVWRINSALSEQMRLTSTGLGIGTNSPQGIFQVVSGSSPNASQVLIGYSGSNNYFDANTNIFRDGSFSELMRLTSTGLGIGTSSPAAPLSFANATGQKIRFYNALSGYGIGVESSEFRFVTDNSAVFTWGIGTYASPSELMRLNTSGNLGIGTSSPAYKLDVVTAGTSGARVYTAEYGQFVVTDGTRGVYIQNYTGLGAIGTSSNNALAFTTNNTERARITSSGNLGVGTTNPQNTISIQVASGSDKGLSLDFNGLATAQFTSDSSTGQIKIGGVNGSAGNYFPVFFSAGSERARIDSSGNLLVGTTSSSSKVTAIQSGTSDVFHANIGASGTAFLAVSSASSMTVGYFITTSGLAGQITCSGTSTTYATSSDYRLKNITGPITTSGAYIDSLNPVEGTWKADGSTFVGLIAHEVQEASRTTVATGTKDGEEMQGMSYSSSEMIANMIAELKALRARVAALEAA